MTGTDRLELVPLTTDQLALYLQGGDRLESLFGLTHTNRSVIPGIRSRVEKTLLSMMRSLTGENYLFYTFWIAIEKKTRTIVAELGFKGLPDPGGQVEIGYGTLPEYRNLGYMSEAVAGLIAWASTQPDVSAVLAETDQDNSASIRVLAKNGFSFLENRGAMKWWRLITKKGRRYNYGE